MSQGFDSPAICPESAGRPWLHFAVAAGLLLVVGAGWQGIMSALRWSMAKSPVPWPAGVKVDEHHRLTTFPEKLGPYLIVQDGEWSGGQTDGMLDGVQVIREEVLEEMGTKDHDLNWYFSGIYRDTRSGGANALPGRHYVQMQISYYTGLLDAVPHIPFVCLGAAGYTVIAGESGFVSVSVPTAARPWNNLEIYRTTFTKKGNKTAQHHFFSVNGKPSADWKLVRGRLSVPWVTSCSVARGQLGVGAAEGGGLLPETDTAKCDELCRDFLAHALPEILRFLPSAEDVAALEKSDAPG